MRSEIFSPELGHPEIQSRILSGIRQNRLPHALLFHGPEGCGKDAFAIAVAQLLNCQTGKETICQQCSQCKKIAHLQHPDVRFVFPTPSQSNLKEEIFHEAIRSKARNPYQRIPFTGKNTLIGIDTIRELKREASFKLSEGKKKVFIISEADKMRTEAANALLKLLEEPPDNLMLLLTTANIYRIIPTIKSRCQVIPFQPLSLSKIQEIVTRIRPAGNTNELALIIRLSGNNLKRVFDFLENDAIKKRDQAVEFLRKLVRIQRSQELLQIVESVSGKKDRHEMQLLLWFLLLWFRDILQLQKNPTEPTNIHNIDLQKNLQDFIAFAPNSNIQSIVWELEEAYRELDDPRNFNPVLILTNLAIKLNRYIKN